MENLTADFNSRPSARGDLEKNARMQREAISIHAPPRGATAVAIPKIAGVVISIHAPPRGATSGAGAGVSAEWYFNSRPSARGDESAFAADAIANHFNSRPSARGDTLRLDVVDCVAVFQFTPLREGRLFEGTGRRAERNFNSRPSARGDDAAFLGHCGCFIISIHAPPRGATWSWRCVATSFRPFQFTPLREGRPASILRTTHSATFQFTPLREGRRKSKRLESISNGFQFTPLREGRRFGALPARHHQAISIHAPPRGATAKKKGIEYESIISIHAPPRGATVIK